MGNKMREKYHAAIEIKESVSFFLRRMKEINECVLDSQEKELISLYGDLVSRCQDLHTFACEVAVNNKPEQVVINEDRGIGEFLSGRLGCSGCSGSCGGCDDD